MGFSNLIVGRWPLGTNKVRFGQRINTKTRQPVKIDMFIFHHAAITNTAGLKAQFVHPARELSSTYAMAQNGDIYGVLDESLRPFTSSTWLADTRAITIEITNEFGAPTWKISDRAFDQLARLIADCATRYGFPINGDHVIGHKEVIKRFGAGISTECPGPWLFSRKNELLALARFYQAQGIGGKPVQPKDIGEVRIGSTLRLSRWVGFQYANLTGRHDALLSGDYEVKGISQGNFLVENLDDEDDRAWVANEAKAGLLLSQEEIDEEDIMSKADDILREIGALKDIVRREARPRLVFRGSTGEVLLYRWEDEYFEGPHKNVDALRAALPLAGEHLLNAQEITNAPRVDDAEWDRLLGLLPKSQ